VRTRLTIDEDAARRLQDKARQSGSSFEDVVNETLRLGLDVSLPKKTPPKFVWRDFPFDIGVPFESTSALLEYLDGPFAR
jgi:hypothetical protein